MSSEIEHKAVKKQQAEFVALRRWTAEEKARVESPAMEPVGATNRSDLFGGGGGTGRGPVPFDDGGPGGGGGGGGFSGRYEEEDGPPVEDDLLEVEHMIGYNGHYRNTLVFHPHEPNAFLMPLGATLVIGDLTDPHQQHFLRGHDAEISAVAISRSGHLVASGQQGSRRTKAHESPVIVWDYVNRSELYQLDGLHMGIRMLAFSPDERFLAASGEDAVLYVWDMQTGEVMCGRKMAGVVSLLTWGAVVNAGRRPEYKLAFACGTALTVGTLAYDVKSMRYELADAPMGMPTGGLSREYAVCTVTADGAYVLAGTTVGELMVFSLEGMVYREAIQLVGHGLLSMALHPVTGELFVGGGDGMVRKVTGSDTRWSVQQEVKVRGCVVSLSISPDGQELLAGTQDGKIYRVRCDDMGVSEYCSSHVAPVAATAFGSRSDIFATTGADGRVCVWDLSDFSLVSQGNVQGAQGLAVAFDNMEESTSVVTGWSDGHVRWHDIATGRQLAEIANAHPGAVTAIASSSSCVISGGGDGTVRVWRAGSREFLCTWSEHKPGNAVTQLLIDCESPWLVHSCGADRAIFTYNLKTERRDVIHQVRDGSFTGMTQLTMGDHELITVGTDGRVMFWDCDVREAIDALWDPNRDRLNAVQLSPSGRFLAYCGDDCAVKLFDLSEGRLVAVGVSHSGPVNCLRWSPDERQLISVGQECCICVWNFYGAQM